MSRWHRNNPEHYEQYGEPDWLGAADLERKRQKEEGGLYACPTCSENVPRYGSTCERCRASLEHDRLERESGR
jgi:hypothetical protein